MLAVSTMLINWSPVVRLSNNPELTVVDTSPVRELMRFISTCVRLSSIPLAIIAAPKLMAQIINHTVLSIPAIPPVDTRSLRAAKPVSNAVEP